MVTLDLDHPGATADECELIVRLLSAAVAGRRTYVSPRTSGCSFTVIVGTTGAPAALDRAIALLESAQDSAKVAAGTVVCAEVTLVGMRPVPAASAAGGGCQNSAP